MSATPAPQPAKLASGQAQDTVRRMLEGRKGPLVDSLLGVNAHEAFAFKSRWTSPTAR
jgi:hypothetical protein